MDWITTAVESIGLVILVIWTVVPIQEFRLIFRRLKEQRHARPTADPREDQ